MHVVNTILRIAALFAVVAALAGCAVRTRTPRPAASRRRTSSSRGLREGTRTLTPAEVAALEPTPYTLADVRFVQGMIHHHAQALHMTALVRARAGSEDIRLLARRMEISQQAELEQLRGWLRARGRAVPSQHRVHGGATMMPGMLTEPELRQLAAARGDAFDRLFLRFMIRHHEGAMTMVARLFAADSGNEPEVSALARHVDADQQVEIARMREALQQSPR